MKNHKTLAKHILDAIGQIEQYTREVSKDDFLTNFMIQLEESGHLDNTIVYFHSDHGNAMPGVYSALGFEDLYKEQSLPAFFLLLPTNMKNYNLYKSTLQDNENSFITPFCVYRSLLAILNDDSINEATNKFPYYKPLDNRTYDIFNEVIPQDRNCNAIIIRKFISGFINTIII